MPDRYYLTTSIAYANNKPGVHTLYEVIGADVIARWYRMKGVDTWFLTGTDEHSINIAQSAVDEGRSAREFVDEKVALFKAAEDALLTTPAARRRWSAAPTRTATSTSAATRAGTARTRGSATRPTWSRPRAAPSARTTPTSRSSGSPRRTGSSACRRTRSGSSAISP